jgi:hypothetical protein
MPDQVKQRQLTNQIAGMISTLTFTPSARHPENCVTIAKRIVEILGQERQREPVDGPEEAQG